MKLDFKNKTYALRLGNEYRNYCDDAGGEHPIHGAYKTSTGEWEFIANTLDGKFYVDGRSYYDLIEVKKTHTITFWVNYYSNSEFTLYYSQEKADLAASRNRIACLQITRTFIDGEGLEDGK